MTTELSTDLSPIEDEKSHPAYAAFVLEMRGRAYGEGPLTQAWHFFKAGWDAESRLLSQQPTAQPQRSGPDVEPMVGMVVRYRGDRSREISETREQTVDVFFVEGIKIMSRVWDEGSYDILSTPDAKEKP